MRHGFVGIIVPSLWGGLGRGLTLLVLSGGHIGPHPTKRLQRTGHAQSLQINSFTPEQGTRKGCPYTACVFGRADLAPIAKLLGRNTLRPYCLTPKKGTLERIPYGIFLFCVGCLGG